MLNFKNTPDFLQRSALLFGEENLQKLRDSHVLVLGLGGVGAYACEMLVRSGLGKITIVDGDTVEHSNLNRQLIALNSTLGEKKSDVLKARLLDINPDCQVNAFFEYIKDDKVDKLVQSEKFDYVVDAIDSLSPKVFFIESCVKHNLPIISSMGSGGKTDPCKIEIGDISKTYNCNLAKFVRKRLRHLGIKKGVMTVFSSELVPESAVYAYQDENNCNRSITGTLSYMPAMFGCTMASYVIKELAK